MSALSIRDIATNLNISYNTAKKMVVDLMDLGTSNIVKYKNTLRVLNMEMFLMELNKKNKIQENQKCERKSQTYLKGESCIGLISPSMVKEYASQLASLL